MTPSELETKARRQYNAVGDSFWSQDEILDLMYDASLELALETEMIERAYSTTTVAGTQQYAFPTNAIKLKRVVYDGQKLTPINFKEDDEITLYDENTTNQGSPDFFYQWNRSVYLRPIPDSAKTLEMYTINAPQAITINGSLELPQELHRYVLAYVLREMVGKDQNIAMYDRYDVQWNNGLRQAARLKMMRKMAAGYPSVINEDAMASTIVGSI
jgi:hypothetical protein